MFPWNKPKVYLVRLSKHTAYNILSEWGHFPWGKVHVYHCVFVSAPVSRPGFCLWVAPCEGDLKAWRSLKCCENDFSPGLPRLSLLKAPSLNHLFLPADQPHGHNQRHPPTAPSELSRLPAWPPAAITHASHRKREAPLPFLCACPSFFLPFLLGALNFYIHF